MTELPTPYEKIVNTPRITYYLLLITSIASTVIGVVFIVFHKRVDGTAISLTILTLTSLALFWVRQKGYYKLAGISLYLLISGVLTYNISIGNGIFDEAILAYPLIIIFMGLLFGKRFVFLTTGVSIVQLSFVYLLAQKGIVQPFNGLVTMRLEETITTIIMLAVTGIVLWIVVDIIERSVLKITRSEQILKDTYDLTLSAWAQALELRGREVPGHSQRVTDLFVRLARQLGFGPEEIDQMRRGVLLHDIGKMGVPESILLKPGTLTEEEWQFVVKHPAMAIQIFQDIPYLKDALDLVFSHHEHLDGGGYPDKLAADEIPAAARAFSIVDNWDVLRSDRPYSKAWTDDEAHSYLQEQAGKKFDPKMVTAFFEMLEAEPQRKSPK